MKCFNLILLLQCNIEANYLNNQFFNLNILKYLQFLLHYVSHHHIHISQSFNSILNLNQLFSVILLVHQILLFYFIYFLLFFILNHST